MGKDSWVSKGPISDYARLLAISAFVGLFVGLAIVALSTLYSALWGLTLVTTRAYSYSIILIPAVGFTLAYLIIRKVAVTKTTGCGTHELLEVYHYEGGVLPEKDTIVKPLASTITIGLGGSAGLEGPSLLLGGGIASAIGRRLNLRPEQQKISLLCGAAAGLSAIFKAPLTGILFALEIPYQRDLAKEAFVSATLASLLAYFTAINLVGSETLFPLIPTLIIPSPLMILHAFAVGLAAVACGAVFVNSFTALDKLKSRFKVQALAYPLVGGLVIGVIGFCAPQVLGVGYDTISEMVTGKFYGASLIFLVALVLLKLFVTSVTLNSGGSGGLFIPSIYVGAVLGAIYAKAVIQSPSEIIVMAAMAAVLAATNKTLLTSVVFVAETTGPSLIIPTLIAAATSYFASGSLSFYRDVQPLGKPIEEEEAVRVLLHQISRQRGFKKLVSTKVSEVMTPHAVALVDTMSIGEAMGIIKDHSYRVYPIVSQAGTLVGYTTVEDLLMIPEEKRHLTVSHMPMRTPLGITKEDDLLRVASRMLERNVDHAYVVSDLQEMKLVGVLADIDILRKLVERLKKQ